MNGGGWSVCVFLIFFFIVFCLYFVIGLLEDDN